MNRTIFGLVCSIIIALMSYSAHALKTDKDQPATIDADNIDMDFKTGQRTYSGNVYITQGSMRLKAHKVVVKMRDGAVSNAVAYGKPAVFRQRPDGKKEDVIGKSKKMELDYSTNTVNMYGGATLIQGRDTTRGAAIHYNMTTDRMKIEGGTSSVKGGAADAPVAPPSSSEEPEQVTPAGPSVAEGSAPGRAKMIIPLNKKEPELPPEAPVDEAQPATAPAEEGEPEADTTEPASE